MGRTHRARVRATIPLDVKTLNVLFKEAHQITQDPAMPIAEYQWLENALVANPGIIPNLRAHQNAIRTSFESALSDALGRVPHEELTSPLGDAHILEFRAPERVGELQERLINSMKYVTASLSQIEGLEPNSQIYCMQLYTQLQSHLYQMAQNILEKPRAQAVP